MVLLDLGVPQHRLFSLQQNSRRIQCSLGMLSYVEEMRAITPTAGFSDTESETNISNATFSQDF
jgi:hypothetical protein